MVDGRCLQFIRIGREHYTYGVQRSCRRLALSPFECSELGSWQGLKYRSEIMVAKRKQHYVPQFYLRLFQSAPQRIHLYDLGGMEPRRNVGIRGQCYRRYFHGRDSNLEDALGESERILSASLRRVVKSLELPPQGSEDHRSLLAFVGLQHLRTQKSVTGFGDIIDKTLVRAFGDINDAPDELVPELTDLLMTSLSMLPNVLELIGDLKAHLVVSRHAAFITSDSPVHIYNQYCEGISDKGITGLASRGLQMFLPLSPSLLLILYDGRTYKIRSSAERSSGRSIRGSSPDVDQLNLVQLLSAERNVYFHDWMQHEDITRLIPRFDGLRIAAPGTVREFQQDDDPNRSLLVMFSRMVNVSLNLSFMTIKKRATRIPLRRRTNLYRDGRIQAERARIWSSDEGTVTFSRLIGES